MKQIILLSFLSISLIACTAVTAPEDETADQTEHQKRRLSPASYQTPWILTQAEELFASLGMGDKKLEELPPLYLETGMEHLMTKINQRTEKFIQLKEIKYPDTTCDLTYEGIQKGDILLSLTRNPILKKRLRGSVCLGDLSE